MGLPPTQKLFVSARPPTASELNYNFYALWNLLNGYIDAANAPTLLSKLTGGDIQAALRIINKGLVIGAATSPDAVAGKFLLDHPAGIIELATQGGAGTVSLRFSQTAGTTVWSLVYDTAAGSLALMRTAAGGNYGIGAPIVLVDAGIVKRTESIYIGTVGFGLTATRIFRIPNDAMRTGGEFKIRVCVVPDTADLNADLDYHYQWINSGEVLGVGGAIPWADFVAAVGKVYISEWLEIAVDPAATDQHLAIQFDNANGAGNYNHVTIELQYKIDRHGHTADAT